MVRRLHIGGKQKRAGWEIFNAVNGPDVDHLGDAKDLSQFQEETFSEIYASHVLEHFDYVRELGATLTEWHRTLQSGGRLYISVPDLDVLTRLFSDRLAFTAEQRFMIMRMIFGGHVDNYDYHKVGLNLEFLSYFLKIAGFVKIRKVDEFDLFKDTSSMRFAGIPISLNIIAEKSISQKIDFFNFGV